MRSDTARFLRLVNEQNAQIVARVTAEGEIRQVGLDEFRLKSDAARRERLGQLRARPHPTKRQHTARIVRGYMETG